ncbi:hypothetical protein [Enterococcus sp. RIT-PI-f]|uniref:hypothetical protein n=1 Tax=Enterococcus sp. RIT-PI-f TaxID=1690244 RepID=UPI0006B93333|nr:hypothetical protein [Enterococcus sp. RIT-PI-f]KPG74252.1 hypothetical protein AEQ18_00395 [Enterococcus sp. RIT-PI-f]
MKNNILGMSVSFNGLEFKNIDVIDFNDNYSLYDYDIVLLDLNRITESYNKGADFNGNPTLTNRDSFKFVSDFKRVKKEIDEFLRMGKTVYVNLPRVPLINVYTGEKEFSGTGKNRRETHIVNQLNLLALLPIKIFTTTSVGGRIDYTTQNAYENLYNINKMSYLYHVYFESKETGEHIASIPQTDKRISESFSVGEGKLIIYPFNFDDVNCSSQTDYRKMINEFLHVIDELEEELRINISEFQLPEWTNKYYILNEQEKVNELDNIEKQLEELEIKKEEMIADLLNLQSYKLMFTSTGKELENIVYKVLHDLGFKNKPVEHNRADGIFEFQENDIVTEIKGIKGSSAEKHGAQLEKWVSEFYEKEDKKAKAILIVNGFREKDLTFRNEDTFPNQMLDYCTKREHCLISTLQLLGLLIETKKYPEKKEELILELISTIGIYNKFLDYTEFLI